MLIVRGGEVDGMPEVWSVLELVPRSGVGLRSEWAFFAAVLGSNLCVGGLELVTPESWIREGAGRLGGGRNVWEGEDRLWGDCFCCVSVLACVAMCMA